MQIRKFTYTSMKISDFKVKRLITLFDEIEKQAGTNIQHSVSTTGVGEETQQPTEDAEWTEEKEENLSALYLEQFKV